MVEALANRPARLRPEFASLSPASLLQHFRERKHPQFFSGFNKKETGSLQKKLFPAKTDWLVESANRIVNEHQWQLLGLGQKDFGAGINWRSDPQSNREWPLEYHHDVTLWHDDGSDIRVLWELNRLPHLLTLGRAYAVTGDECFAEEFFNQIMSWSEQNPVGMGPNWACSMEVGLRAQNLLGCVSFFKGWAGLNEERLGSLLTLLDQHGAHIKRNLEYSYLATSNHYLCNVAALLWIGLFLPELADAEEWREWALTELMREMDKQVLPDGAQYENSTGYHCLVLEQFLYSFVLCQVNEIEVSEDYWERLKSMLSYLNYCMRPDGKLPLIGDADSGQVLPLSYRTADDRAYLLALGAALFGEASFKKGAEIEADEMLWILGEQGVDDFKNLSVTADASSRSFPFTGTYLLREKDLYLTLSASSAGLGGRGSHRHNDLLSIEVAACGRPFIVDPGSYVYTADLRERHLFRSTAYHSTIQIDEAEQNSIKEDRPFVIGNEAKPALLDFETGIERDQVTAEHRGYLRLSAPVTHRRKVMFVKMHRCWLIEDELSGKGEHSLTARFHFDSDLEVEIYTQNSVVVRDRGTGAKLYVHPLALELPPVLERLFSSREYGKKKPSVSAAWTINSKVPCTLTWALIPVCPGEDENERLKVLSEVL